MSSPPSPPARRAPLSVQRLSPQLLGSVYWRVLGFSGCMLAAVSMPATCAAQPSPHARHTTSACAPAPAPAPAHPHAHAQRTSTPPHAHAHPALAAASSEPQARAGGGGWGGGQAHVPFRNSKLTHLLSPSLGRDAKTLMLANVSPLSPHFQVPPHVPPPPPPLPPLPGPAPRPRFPHLRVPAPRLVAAQAHTASVLSRRLRLRAALLTTRPVGIFCRGGSSVRTRARVA